MDISQYLSLARLPVSMWLKPTINVPAQSYLPSFYCSTDYYSPGQFIGMKIVLLLVTSSLCFTVGVPLLHIEESTANSKNLCTLPSTKCSISVKQNPLSARKEEPPTGLQRVSKSGKVVQDRIRVSQPSDRGPERGDPKVYGSWERRRLLDSESVREETILVVSTDGNPNHFSTVQEAVNAVPMGNNITCIIYIEPGTYYGTLVVPRGKDHITLLGEENPRNSTLTYTRRASDENEIGILDSATVIIEASHFVARNIIFENSSPKPADHDFSSQTPAIRISGDKCEFYGCTFLGWQDTLYADQGRHYYKDCRVEGNVDFILGYASALFENCTIYSRSPGFITAQSRWCDSLCRGADSAFVFLRCNLIGSSGPTYLGRPWREHAKVIYIDTWMGAHIAPEGWQDWMTDNGPLFNHTHVYFAESNSTGLGANPEARVNWSLQIADSEVEAKHYRDAGKFFQGSKWFQHVPPSIDELRKSDSWPGVII